MAVAAANDFVQTIAAGSGGTNTRSYIAKTQRQFTLIHAGSAAKTSTLMAIRTGSIAAMSVISKPGFGAKMSWLDWVFVRNYAIIMT